MDQYFSSSLIYVASRSNCKATKLTGGHLETKYFHFCNFQTGLVHEVLGISQENAHLL